MFKESEKTQNNYLYDEPINRLYKTSTHSGRKIIFLKDDAGNVQLLNPNDVQLIKDLEKKFEVVS